MCPCFRGPALASLVAALCAGCGLVLDLGGEERAAPRDGGTGADAGQLDAGDSDAGEGGSTDAGDPDPPDAAIAPAPPVLLSPTAGRQAYPSILWTGDHFAVALLASTDSTTSMPRLYRFRAGQTEPFEPPLDLASAHGLNSTTTMALHGTKLAVGWVGDVGGTPTMQGAMVADRVTRATGMVGPVTRSMGVRDVRFFSFAGELWSVLRTPGDAFPAPLSYVSLGPDGTSAGSVVRIFSEHTGEVDVVHSAGTPFLATGYSGAVSSFDGANWQTIAEVRTVLANTEEPGIAPRAGGGLWAVWSQDVGTEPSVMHAVSIQPDETPVAQRLEGWQGADPVLASYDGRLMMAAVQQESATAPRHLALGELEADGTGAAPPCVVPVEAGYSFTNDPDIACGEGWCAVVWLEGSERLSDEFVVRFAQFPAGDPSHLCP